MKDDFLRSYSRMSIDELDDMSEPGTFVVLATISRVVTDGNGPPRDRVL